MVRILIFFLSFSWLNTLGQTVKEPNLFKSIIDNKQSYIRSILGKPNKAMENVNKIPGVVLDLRYASTNNFMHKKLYHGKVATTYLRKNSIDALIKVQQTLKLHNIGIKIWDAYRPYTVTKQMWTLIHDERYVANPSRGSGHNRGIAVDLTLIDLSSRKPLNMGTEFDNFTDTAHTDFIGLPNVVLQNRKLLKTVMEQNGFISLSTEWWHYSIANYEEDEIIDLNFNRLFKLVRRTRF